MNLKETAIDICNFVSHHGFSGLSLGYVEQALIEVQCGTHFTTEVPETGVEPDFLTAASEAYREPEVPDVEQEIDNGLAKTQGALKGRRGRK